MVGVVQSLEVVLKCLKSVVSKLIAFFVAVERRVRGHLTWTRTSRVFSHKNIVRILKGSLEMLAQRSWSVPLVDWVTNCEAPILEIFADAAISKEKGLAYSETVWGRAAYCSFKGVKFFQAEMHSRRSIEIAKRSKSLSANYLELENYVLSAMLFVELTGAKRVHLTGDSRVALGWIDVCVPLGPHAKAFVDILIQS
jgi:hypothetical protein